MGGNKDIMDGLDFLRARARGVMRRAGVLDHCEFHGLHFDTGADVEAAYRLGNALITKGEIDLLGHSRTEFTDAIKYELDANASLGGCPRCG